MLRIALLAAISVMATQSFANDIVHTLHVSKGAYKTTVSRWLTALNNHSKISSTTYIVKKAGGKDRLHKVGHRDVIIWLPSTSHVSENLKIILWFHGHGGYNLHRTFQDRILKQFNSQAMHNQNFIIVLPEMPWSTNTQTPTKRNGQVWKKPGDFLKFIEQIENILVGHLMNQILEDPFSGWKISQLGKIEYMIVGHSAGGSTIATLGHTGDLCKINPSRVVWSDSSYGSWLSKAWTGCLESHNIRTEVFVRKYGPPWHSAMKLLKKLHVQPKFLHIHTKNKPWTHKLIGNNIVELSGILE